MKLPNLHQYRTTILAKGVNFPLAPSPASVTGLLKELPIPPAGKTGWPWTEETNPAVYTKGLNTPKFTIVTPSYNQGAFIEETIRSVLLQNYPNLEYIVIDGGSTDNTKEILEKYSPWLSYWHTEKDGGQGEAINQGFSLASGDYYAWINSDDYYLKDVLHLVTKAFIKTKAKFIYGYNYNFDVSAHTFKLTKVLPLLDFFIKIPGLSQPSTFWSATIHQPIWEELNCSLDFELWIRMVKGNKRHLIKAPLSVANVHDDAKTHDPKMKMKWDEDHQKIWSADGHGEVYEWKRISFLNKIRVKLYRLFKLI